MLIWAYQNKKANLVDVYDFLLGPRKESSSTTCFQLCQRLRLEDQKKKSELSSIKNLLSEAIGKVVEHLFEIEIVRGEAATMASAPALAINCLRGTDKLRRLLIAIGKHGFKKNNSYSRETKDIRLATFTDLVEKCYPADQGHAGKLCKANEAGTQIRNDLRRTVVAISILGSAVVQPRRPSTWLERV